MAGSGGSASGRRRAVVLLLVLGVAAAIGGCGDDDPAASPSDADRGAAEQRATGGWDLEFDLRVTNRTSRPVELGVLMSTGRGGEVFVAPPAWSPAGDGRTITVPAADGDDMGQATVLVQMKQGNDHKVSRPLQPSTPDPQAVLLVLPTVQFEVTLSHTWKQGGCQTAGYGFSCDWTMLSSVSVNTRDNAGFQAPLSDLFPCPDPTHVVAFPWNPAEYEVAGIPPSGFDLIDVELRDIATMNDQNCGGADKAYTTLSLPGISLSDGSTGIDLARTNLAGAQLPGADLRHADLSRAVFAGPTRANLAYADLRDADLSYADLTGADLTGARLDGANLEGAILDKAILFGVDLSTTRGKIAAGHTNEIRTCRTTPPPTETGILQTADMNRDCGTSIEGLLGNATASSVFNNADTGIPLVLLSSAGDIGCNRIGTVGAHQAIPFPAAPCRSVYRSAAYGGDVSIATVGTVGGVGSLGLSGASASNWGGIVCTASTMVDGKCPDTLAYPAAAG